MLNVDGQRAIRQLYHGNIDSAAIKEKPWKNSRMKVAGPLSSVVASTMVILLEA